MTTVKNQLRAFYVKQGLTGKHLRMALRHDMKAVAKQAYDSDWPHFSIIEAFCWVRTSEGSRYWYERHKKK